MVCVAAPDSGAAAGVYNRTWDNLNIYRTNMTYHCPVGQGRISSILIGPAHTILRSHWSRASFLVLKYFHALTGPIVGALSVATPAILCHKEPARASNAPY